MKANDFADLNKSKFLEEASSAIFQRTYKKDLDNIT